MLARAGWFITLPSNMANRYSVSRSGMGGRPKVQYAIKAIKIALPTDNQWSRIQATSLEERTAILGDVPRGWYEITLHNPCKCGECGRLINAGEKAMLPHGDSDRFWMPECMQCHAA